MYEHPFSPSVRRLEFNVLSGKVDLRNLTNVERIYVRVFTKTKAICDYVLSDHAVKINDKDCVSIAYFPLSASLFRYTSRGDSSCKTGVYIVFITLESG